MCSRPFMPLQALPWPKRLKAPRPSRPSRCLCVSRADHTLQKAAIEQFLEGGFNVRQWGDGGGKGGERGEGRRVGEGKDGGALRRKWRGGGGDVLLCRGRIGIASSHSTAHPARPPTTAPPHSPNPLLLHSRSPQLEAIVYQVENGKGAMPAWDGRLSERLPHAARRCMPRAARPKPLGALAARHPRARRGCAPPRRAWSRGGACCVLDLRLSHARNPRPLRHSQAMTRSRRCPLMCTTRPLTTSGDAPSG